MKPLEKVCFSLAGICVLLCLENMLFGLRHIGILLLFLLGVVFFLFPLLWRKTQKKSISRGLVIGVYALGFGVAAVLSGFMAYRAWLVPPSPTLDPHYLVVLGGGLVEERPSLMLRRRLDTAEAYLETNPHAICIVSGGQGADEIIPEALAMQNYLVEQGVAEERILMESRSTNTRENLRFSMELLPQSYTNGVTIVSDGYHQARAYLTAKDLGLIPVYALSAPTSIDLLPAYWLRDLAGIIPTWLEIKGISLPFLP